MASETLERFHPLLRAEKDLRPVLGRVSHHRDAESIIAFFNAVAKAACIVNDSVRTCLLIVDRVAQEGDCLPAAEFEILRDDGEHLLVDTACNVAPVDDDLSEADVSEEFLADDDGVLPASFEDIAFSGMDGLSFDGFANLQRLLMADRLNPHCEQEFLQAPRELGHPWKLDSLFQFYAEHGDHTWLCPVRDFRSLGRVKHIDAIRDAVLDAMVNAGRLGFCPTQFLRRVVLPQLKYFKTARDLERLLTPLFEMLLDVRARLGEVGGDGSASNLFTLKYFARTIAQPTSKLLVSGFYDRRGSPRSVFHALGECWLRAFARERECLETRSAMMRTYVHRSLRLLTRIENPYEIVRGFRHAAEHLERVGRTLHAVLSPAETAEALRWDVHETAFLHLEKTLGQTAKLLQLCKAHMKVVEQFVDEKDFGHRYSCYLQLLGSGAFHTPEDIDFYLHIRDSLTEEQTKRPDVLEFIDDMLHQARDAESREDLIRFLHESPFMEKHLYAAWRASGEDRRAALIEQAERRFRAFLYGPMLRQPALDADLDVRSLETAFSVKLVRSSTLSKRNVLDGVRAVGDDLGGIPKHFRRPQVFHVAQAGDDAEELRVAPDNLRYLREKMNAVRTAARAHSLEDAEHMAVELADELLARRRGLAAKLGESPVNDKKSRGIRKQMETFQPFVDLMRSLEEADLSRRALTSQLVQAGLAVLGAEKSLHKRSSERFAALVLTHQYRTVEPVARTLAPYGILDAVPADADAFSASALDALRQVLCLNTQGYFLELFETLADELPTGLSAALNRCFESAGLEHLVEADAAGRAAFFHDAFVRYQGVRTLEAELRSARAAAGEQYHKIPLALVPARKPMDRFFGAVGENCTSAAQNEIRRPAFIPVRIVDVSRNRIEGYIHLLETRRGNERALLVVGIEPKESFLSKLRVLEFYVKTRKALIAYAEAGDYAWLAYPDNWIALSNRDKLRKLMETDMKKKPDLDLGRVTFPKGSYAVGKAKGMWKATDAADDPPQECETGTAVSA